MGSADVENEAGAGGEKGQKSEVKAEENDAELGAAEFEQKTEVENDAEFAAAESEQKTEVENDAELAAAESEHKKEVGNDGPKGSGEVVGDKTEVVVGTKSEPGVEGALSNELPNAGGAAESGHRSEAAAHGIATLRAQVTGVQVMTKSMKKRAAKRRAAARKKAAALETAREAAETS